MTALRVISLIGLPGAGKTTLGRALASQQECKCTYFGVGEALRKNAERDPKLRKQLDDGRLGPEALTLRIVGEAYASCATEVLILDGFPRHAAQVPFATENFQQWHALYLDIEKRQAAVRLSTRRICDTCGVPADGSMQPCLQCGGQNWKRRSEDSDLVLVQRLDSAGTHVQSLVESLKRTSKVTRIDGTVPANELLKLVIVAIP